MPFPIICITDRQRRPNEWPTLRFRYMTHGYDDVCLYNSDGQVLELDSSVHTVKLYINKSWDPCTPCFVCITGEILDSLGHVRFSTTGCDLCFIGLFNSAILVYDNTIEMCSTICEDIDTGSDSEGSDSGSGSEGSDSEGSDSGSGSETLYPSDFIGGLVHRFKAYTEIYT